MRIEDVFPELENAVIQNREISCSRHERNGRVRWVIEIDDPEAAKSFQDRMLSFLDGIKAPQEGRACP